MTLKWVTKRVWVAAKAKMCVRLDIRQCVIYDSAAKNARLIGVEYMITKEIYETLDPEEQKLWHSHEVISSPSDSCAPEKSLRLSAVLVRSIIGHANHAPPPIPQIQTR
jgi:hypothetical protein